MPYYLLDPQLEMEEDDDEPDLCDMCGFELGPATFGEDICSWCDADLVRPEIFGRKEMVH